MTYEYDRTAASPGPEFKEMNAVMGRAKKVYAAYLTQKTGVPWEVSGSYGSFNSVKHVWYGPQMSLSLDIHSMVGRVPPEFNYRFNLHTNRGDKWSEVVDGISAEDLKNPAFVIPASILKDIQYALSGSTSQEVEMVAKEIQNALGAANAKISALQQGIAELSKWSEGSPGQIAERIRRDRVGFMKAYGKVTEHQRDMDRLLTLALGRE